MGDPQAYPIFQVKYFYLVWVGVKKRISKLNGTIMKRSKSFVIFHFKSILSRAEWSLKSKPPDV